MRLSLWNMLDLCCKWFPYISSAKIFTASGELIVCSDTSGDGLYKILTEQRSQWNVTFSLAVYAFIVAKVFCVGGS